MIYAYVRVSTERQVDKESLGVQSRAVNGYAMMKGLPDPILFIEKGETASIALADRTEGAALLAALQPGDTIIITAIDRAFRSGIDALTVFKSFVDRGIQLHVIAFGGDVTADGPAKLIFGILALVAEDERDRLRGRICDVKRDQKERGRYLGGDVPWGYVVAEGALVESPDRAPAIDAMRTLRGQGMSLRRVAEEMRRRGVPISHEKVRQAIAA